MGESLLTWTTRSDQVKPPHYDLTENFNNNFYDYSSSVTEENYGNYDYYNGNGITGANVLTEMRPNPTRPSFITGNNVIRNVWSLSVLTA